MKPKPFPPPVLAGSGSTGSPKASQRKKNRAPRGDAVTRGDWAKRQPKSVTAVGVLFAEGY